MSARDELALDIFLADNSSIPEGELRQDWVDAPDRHRPYAQNIADGLIAKGYCKPRTVLTGAELDALPAGAVVLGRDGAACQKEEIPGLWGSAGELFSTDFVALPATVLWEPEAQDLLAGALADPEGRALVKAIHNRKSTSIG